ncbi:hypothetical protein LB503_005090 [Fusarium chuoi]|nr:hypothetical protein LB503_005090 [Fusarium chuoi]
MRCDFCWEISSVADTFHNTGYVGSAVQLAHFFRYTDVLVDKRFVIDDHVFFWCFRVGGFFESVCLTTEEVLPDILLYEVEEGNDAEWSGLRTRWFAEEEKIEEFEADRVALKIKSAHN